MKRRFQDCDLVVQLRLVASRPVAALPTTSFDKLNACVDVTSSIASVASRLLPDCGKISPVAWDSTLTFFVNGVPVMLTNPDPTMMLSEYIRDVLLLSATKVRLVCC